MRVAGALLCAAVVTVVPATAGGSDDTARVRNALNRLVGDTRKLPRKAASTTTKARLVRAAVAVRRASRRKPCASLRLLEGYTRALRGVSARGSAAARKRRPPGPPSRRGALLRDAVAAVAALNQVPASRGCGGGATSATPVLQSTVTQSDASGLTMHVDLPVAHWGAQSGGGRDFVGLDMDGTDSVGSPGDPGVPAFTRLFAVPQGTDATATVSNVTGYAVKGLDLFP